MASVAQYQMYARAARFVIEYGYSDHTAALFIDKLCNEGRLNSPETFGDVLNRLIEEED